MKRDGESDGHGALWLVELDVALKFGEWDGVAKFFVLDGAGKDAPCFGEVFFPDVSSKGDGGVTEGVDPLMGVHGVREFHKKYKPEKRRSQR